MASPTNIVSRIFRPRGMAGQISIIIFGITLLVHTVVTLTIHFSGLSPRSPPLFIVAQQISTMVRMLDALPAADQDALTAAFKAAHVARCASSASVTPRVASSDRANWLVSRIREDIGDPMRPIVVERMPERGASLPEVIVQLQSGVCATLNMNAEEILPRPRRWPIHFGLLTLIVVVGTILLPIALISIWATYHVTRPLAGLVKSVEQFGREGSTGPVAEEGPVEIRRAARAFNLMQERLHRFVEDRTTMLAAISHDFRTILTRLRMRVHGVADPEMQSAMLHDIGLMDAMVASSLSFVRDDVLQEKVERVDLSSVLESLCDEFADMSRQVSYEGPADYRFRCRPLALSRAISNLIENAIKYGSSAIVRLLPIGSSAVQITVEDDGPGIPQSEREKVFEPFYRIDTARTMNVEGVGLGLSIVRTIVHAHGGKIELLDQVPRGLRVQIQLPAR